MIALITGGTKGIGKATVLEFLRRGAQVITCARNISDDVKEELSSFGQVILEKCDVSNPTHVLNFRDKVIRKTGKIHVLVNNAGILGERVPISEYPTDVWEEVIKTNVNGVFFMTKFFLPYMEDGGVIINISSGVGVRPAPFWGAYAVSKWAVEGFTKLLAEELKGKIHVYSLNPGGTRTEMRRKAYPDENPSSLPPPEKVASVIVKLALEKFAQTGSHIFARDFF